MELKGSENGRNLKKMGFGRSFVPKVKMQLSIHFAAGQISWISFIIDAMALVWWDSLITSM